MGPPAPPAVDAVAPAPAPEHPQTPPRPPSPVAPPRPPSPVGIGARLPRCTRNKPREWWKLSAAQLDSNIDDDIKDADIAYEVAYSSTAAAVLKKSIYGTKQGGNRWNQKMRSVLKAIGYTQTYSDASIYIYFKDNVKIILPVFVDDMTFALKSEAAIDIRKTCICYNNYL